MKIDTRKIGKAVKYEDRDSGYSVQLFSTWLNEPVVSFYFPLKMGDGKNMSMVMTARDSHEHEKYGVMKELQPLNPCGRYVEVGSGLAETSQVIANQLTDGELVIIDPVDYGLFEKMLRLIQEGELGELEICRQRMSLLELRVRTIRNHRKIRIITETLGEAVTNHPEIIKSADFLLDVYGPAYHTMTEPDHNSIEDITGLERELVKSGGKLIQAGFRDLRVIAA